MHKDFETAPGIDSHALLVISFADGSTGIVDTSCTAAIEKPHFYLVGSNATFAKYGGTFLLFPPPKISKYQFLSFPSS